MKSVSIPPRIPLPCATPRASREGFARGALRAARWVVGKKGLFEFREILSELR